MRLVISTVLMVMMFTMGIPATTIAGEAAAVSRVYLVAPFENLSGLREMIAYEVAGVPNTQSLNQGPSAAPVAPTREKRTFQIDRLSDAPRTILEDILVNTPGAKVVERQRVDGLLQESAFTGSGLADPASAVALGKMAGATSIVLGTISQLNVTEKTFTGYGVATNQVVSTADVRVRIIDIATSEVVFSKTVTGSHSVLKTQFNNSARSDLGMTLIKDALAKLVDDPAFKGFIHPVVNHPAQAVAKVDVAIEPTVPNCDIEIDGAFSGNTPATISFTDGQPVKLRISKAGYAAWEKSILPRAGLRITPELAKAP